MYVTTLVVPSESVASAVTPTTAALSAFSATVFVALSASEGEPTSNSSKSVTEIVNVVAAVLESALVAVISTVHEVADS